MLAESTELGARIPWKEGTVIAGEGRRSRSRFDADQSWWQRIEVTEDRQADCLRLSPPPTARAEESLAEGQLRLADRFIAQRLRQRHRQQRGLQDAVRDAAAAAPQAELADQRAIVILLDEAAARFPLGAAGRPLEPPGPPMPAVTRASFASSRAANTASSRCTPSRIPCWWSATPT